MFLFFFKKKKKSLIAFLDLTVVKLHTQVTLEIDYRVLIMLRVLCAFRTKYNWFFDSVVKFVNFSMANLLSFCQKTLTDS